ncbi:hypothetical protein [Alkalicoccus luteus]|uniref:Uncharacterized protein n=1 Tax=Alkalicoccus luteus TaxID=1237094 RepID=A0A969PQW5_9BACI|nr:hypothetical protein [Alkalicoccus luteus]NJP37905.1 hypothetical protein [Alkalicoccus luteus]
MDECNACNEKFEWDDRLIIVEDKYYHKDCVTLYATGYVAFLDDDPLGETENDDGQDAYEIIDGLLGD